MSMQASKGHRSLMVIVARLESGICKDPGFTTASVHLVFFVLKASKTGLLLVVKLGRNVVMMRAIWCISKVVLWPLLAKQDKSVNQNQKRVSRGKQF